MAKTGKKYGKSKETIRRKINCSTNKKRPIPKGVQKHGKEW